jgi:hypothetical protein
MSGNTGQHIGEPGLGSMSLSFAVTISPYSSAARSPPRSEPAKSQALRPRARPRNARSAALLVRQMRPSSRKRVNEAQRPYPCRRGLKRVNDKTMTDL